jgi:hypothetical protein
MKNLKQITLKGIDRASGRFTDQGILQEAINVRKRNSANYQVVGKKDVIAEFQHDAFGVDLEAYTILYRFPALDTYELIGADDITQRIYKIELTEVTNILNYSGDVKLITHLGNILIIHTTLYVYYLKYDTDLDTFTELPTLLIPQFFLEGDLATISTWSSVEKPTLTDAVAEYISHDSEVKKDGFGEGVLFGIFAYRLFDGSYIMHSQPVPCTLGDTGGYLVIGDGSTIGTYTFKDITHEKIIGKYSFTQYNEITVDHMLGPWEGIIISMCLFITKPISKFNINAAESLYYAIHDDPGKNQLPSNPDIRNSNQAALEYYKIHEISLAQIITDSGEAEFSPVVGPWDLLLTNPLLPVDENTNHSLIADHAYLYNSRLHYSNILTSLSPGHNMNCYADGTQYRHLAPAYSIRTPGASQVDIYVKTYLHTSDGERSNWKALSEILGEVSVWEDPGVQSYILLNPILSYPDIRAYKMEFYMYDIGNSKYYQITFPQTVGSPWTSILLTPHPFQNFASYLNTVSPVYDNINNDWPVAYYRTDPIQINLSSIGNELTFNAFTIALPGWTTNSGSPNNLVNDINRIQLTGLNNPFVYPAGNSYRVGNHHNTVVATASMGESISQGQFGQFPLYAFSTQGIWTLEVGSGEVVYGSIHPLNSDVLMVNVYDPKVRMLCNIGMGIVYATSKGLFVITGNQVQEISTAIEGRNDNPVLTKNEYDGYISTDCFVILKDYLSNIPFIEYLDDAIIGYDRKNKEIIISSRSYNDLHTYQGAGSTSTGRNWEGTGVGIPMVDDASRAGYSYVFSLVSKEWTKITQRWYTFFDAYPNTYAVVGNCLYDLTVELTDNNQVLLQTRPITIQGHTFKRLLGANLYGHFEPEVNTFAAFYAWGSQDGEHWELIQGQQMPFIEHEFISLQRAEWGWCRYFIFMASGQLSCDSFYEGIEIDFSERYTKKLR